MDKSTKELLAQAEKLCAQRNVRLTPQRLEVLRLMSLQQGAISAYDLLDLLRESEPQAKPPTVYRALDFLLEQGFVHKVESTNSYVLCHLFDQPTHTSAMFICDRCGVVKEEFNAKDFPVNRRQNARILIRLASDHHAIHMFEVRFGLVQRLNTAIDRHGQVLEVAFQLVHARVVQRRDLAVFFRAEA